MLEVFAFTGSSARSRREIPVPGDNFAVIDMRRSACAVCLAAEYGADCLEFAINTFGERAHPDYPAEFDIYID